MKEASCDLLIHGGPVLSMDRDRTIYDPGAVAIEGSHIVEVGKASDLRAKYAAERSVDAEGGIVHPGLIDAHNHIVHTSCRGVLKNIHDTGAVNFATWKASVTDEDERAATIMAGLEMLRGGFTMFIEPGSLFSTDAGARAVEELGMRALFSPLYLWDRREPFEAIPALESPSLMARAPIDHDRCVAAIDAELHRNADPEALVRGYVFIYGEGTASPELLRAAHACAKENGVAFQLHAGYVPMGAEIYQRMTGTSQVAHLMELGVLDEGTVIVHANVLNEADEAALRDGGCQIVWCPGAYLSLGLGGRSGFEMAARARRGTRISLGTDGAFDAPPAGMMRAARYVSQLHADPIAPDTLIEMQTLNAAAAAGMESEVGSLEAGKRADVVVRSARAAEAYPGNNPCHSLALNLGSGSVSMVVVNGEVILADGVSTRVDELQAYRRVRESVFERAGRLGIAAGPEWPVVEG